MLEKVFRLILSFTITVWMANYLGPSDFGLFNYALSFVILFSVLSNLGFDKLIAKEAVTREDKEDIIIASSLQLRLIGGLLMILVTPLIIYLLKPEDKSLLIMVAIISTGYLFKSFEVIRFWFESKVKSVYSSFAESVALVISFSVKVLLIKLNAKVEYFAISILLEYVVLSIILLIMYLKFKKAKSFFFVSYNEM